MFSALSYETGLTQWGQEALNMANTISQSFEQLQRNLNITELQEETASTRQKKIREVIESEMKVLDSFLTGSYRRSTMIAPLKEADIDIFVVLDPGYHKPDGQASLLDTVKQVLRKTYTRTPDISRNGQAVTITFEDFSVDVVPGFYRKGGGYLIPDAIKKRWIETDPKQHVDIWATANKAHDGKLVPVIKMIKAWNKKHSQMLRSFHLECMVLQILNNVTVSDYPSGVRYVFDKARTLITQQIPDPAGYAGDVGDYLDPNGRQEVATRLQRAYERAAEAEKLGSDDRTQPAFERWRQIFDDYFPAYG
jgi:hypothetical protein